MLISINCTKQNNISEPDDKMHLIHTILAYLVDVLECFDSGDAVLLAHKDILQSNIAILHDLHRSLVLYFGSLISRCVFLDDEPRGYNSAEFCLQTMKLGTAEQ